MGTGTRPKTKFLNYKNLNLHGLKKYYNTNPKNLMCFKLSVILYNLIIIRVVLLEICLFFADLEWSIKCKI